jgi:hypothetical protein
LLWDTEETHEIYQPGYAVFLLIFELSTFQIEVLRALALHQSVPFQKFKMAFSTDEKMYMYTMFYYNQGPDFDDMSSFFLYAVNVAFNY